MKSQQTTRRNHLVLALAGLGLVATACGAETATSTPSAEPAPTTAAPITSAPATAAPTTTVDEAPVEPTDVPAPAPTTTVPATTTPGVEPTDPEPPVIDDLADEDETGPCTVAPMPADAVIGGEIVVEDELGQHRVVSYSSAGTWKLRAEFAFGAASEIVVPGSEGVRPLGFADVDLTYGGDELVAVVGGSEYTEEIGFFAFLEGGCIHRYQDELGGHFGLQVGFTDEAGQGLACRDGQIVNWGYYLEDDQTYSRWSAAYEPVSLPVIGNVPGSEEFATGFTFDEVASEPIVDCFGLEL